MITLHRQTLDGRWIKTGIIGLLFLTVLLGWEIYLLILGWLALLF